MVFCKTVFGIGKIGARRFKSAAPVGVCGKGPVPNGADEATVAEIGGTHMWFVIAELSA